MLRSVRVIALVELLLGLILMRIDTILEFLISVKIGRLVEIFVILLYLVDFLFEGLELLRQLLLLLSELIGLILRGRLRLLSEFALLFGEVGSFFYSVVDFFVELETFEEVDILVYLFL